MSKLSELAGPAVQKSFKQWKSAKPGLTHPKKYCLHKTDMECAVNHLNLKTMKCTVHPNLSNVMCDRQFERTIWNLAGWLCKPPELLHIALYYIYIKKTKTFSTLYGQPWLELQQTNHAASFHLPSFFTSSISPLLRCERMWSPTASCSSWENPYEQPPTFASFW